MPEAAPVPCSAATAPLVRVGVDVASIDEVAASCRHFGDRYLRRVFSDDEIASCRGLSGGRGAPGGGGTATASPSAGPSAASLAARFAAKEAVLKVLEPTGARPAWPDIEVVRQASGACRIRLHGRAAALAQRRGVGPISVSLSHEAGVAVAVAAAVCPAAGSGAGCGAGSPSDDRIRTYKKGRKTVMTTTDEGTQRIRDVLAEHGRLPVDVSSLRDDDDLFQAGMTSHASVNVMLALEDAFDVEFPEAMLRKSTFSSVRSLRNALEALETMEVPA